MSELMVSVAGIRGIIGDSFTPDIIVKYVTAFAKYCKEGTIIVGRDTRPSGKQVSDLVCSTLNMCGIDVVDVGIATTPTIEMGVIYHKAAGGIAITASHNPINWNALKFFGSDTLFLDEDQGKELQTILKDINDKEKQNEISDYYVEHDKLGITALDSDDCIKNFHIKKVLDIPYINKSAIRKKEFKVVLDCVNGAGSAIMPDLLVALGCTVSKLSCNFSGIFTHGAEPLPENLTEISEFMKKGNYDIGMVVDPDSDRLALVSDAGIPLGEEYTLAMVTDLIMSKAKTNTAVNVSTSMVIDEVAARYNAEVYRTKVGEVNVSKRMIRENCIIGGEGNGGIILPEVHPGRDAIVGAALILQYMLEKDDFVSNIFADLPSFYIIKDKISIDGLDYDKLVNDIISKEKLNNAVVDEIDGVKLIFDSGEGKKYWIQMRKSNTEPIARIFVEATNKEIAKSVLDDFKSKYDL